MNIQVRLRDFQEILTLFFLQDCYSLTCKPYISNIDCYTVSNCSVQNRCIVQELEIRLLLIFHESTRFQPSD